MIIEALKEQQARIKELEEEVKSSSKNNTDNATVNNFNLRDKENQKLQDKEVLINSELYQNAPNPFSEKTEIRYFIPLNALSAFIYIFDMQGKLIDSLPIKDLGNGFVTINSYQYVPGMYLYSLFVNGQEVNSKRMILTE